MCVCVGGGGGPVRRTRSQDLLGVEGAYSVEEGVFLP